MPSLRRTSAGILAAGILLSACTGGDDELAAEPAAEVAADDVEELEPLLQPDAVVLGGQPGAAGGAQIEAPEQESLVAADEDTLVFDEPVDLELGQVIASAPVDGVAPDGLLVRVLEITDAEGRTEVTVEPAGLTDLFVQADLEHTFAIDLSDPAEVFADGEPFPQVLGETLTLASYPPQAVGVEGTVSFSVAEDDVTYTGAAGAAVELILDAKIRNGRFTKFELSAGGETFLESDVAIERVGRELRDGPPKDLWQRKLATRVFWVGAIPVALTPTLRIDGAVNGRTKSVMTISSRFSASRTLGVRWADNGQGWDGFNEGELTSEIDVDGALEAGITARLGLNLDTKFYLAVPGPTLTFAPGLTAAAATSCPHLSVALVDQLHAHYSLLGDDGLEGLPTFDLVLHDRTTPLWERPETCPDPDAVSAPAEGATELAPGVTAVLDQGDWRPHDPVAGSWSLGRTDVPYPDVVSVTTHPAGSLDDRIAEAEEWSMDGAAVEDLDVDDPRFAGATAARKVAWLSGSGDMVTVSVLLAFDDLVLEIASGLFIETQLEGVAHNPDVVAETLVVDLDELRAAR